MRTKSFTQMFLESFLLTTYFSLFFVLLFFTGHIGCVQQRKSLNERSLILYYDWFLHLDPAKI